MFILQKKKSKMTRICLQKEAKKHTYLNDVKITPANDGGKYGNFQVM